MSETVSCHSCGRLVARDDSFCPGCGSSLDDADTATGTEAPNPGTSPTQCVRCAAPMGSEDRFCRSCGTSRPEEATVVSHVSLNNAQAAHLIQATEGEFEILEQVGHGAMGSVYLARDVALNRRVAIKVIAPHLLADETMVSRFRLEAQTVASLRHPSIVNIHGVRQSDDLHYFVMEFIDGPSLRSVIKRHAPLDTDVVKGILYQVGSALDYAHRAGGGVIHRDIKPANVMVSAEGDSFLTDFGISKIADMQSGLTQTGATIGTPEYMSPEQCRGESLTGASDQYALGIVAYEMLCGGTPFSGTHYSIMMAHTQEPPPPVRESRPDCPADIAEAVERMLAKSPEDRWPALETAVASMGGGPMGYQDPTRAKIVALIAETVSVRGGGTVPSVTPEPTPAPQRPTPTAVERAPGPATPPRAEPESTPVAQPARAAAASAAAPVGAPATVVEPSPGPRASPPVAATASSSRRGLVLVSSLAALVVLGFGLRAAFTASGGVADGPAGDPAAESPVLEATGSGENASLDSAQVIERGMVPLETEAAADPVETPPPTSPAAEPPTTEQPADTRGNEAEETPSAPQRPVPTPTRVVVRLAAPSMEVGGRQTAAAEVLDEAGSPMSGVRVSWSSSDIAVAAVDANSGVVRAVGEGSAWVVASIGTTRDSIEVSATVAVAALEIVGGNRSLEVGESATLRAGVTGPDGESLTRPVTWSVSDESVVSISTAGLLRAVTAGRAEVVARADGVEDRISVTVQAAAPTLPSDVEVTTLLEEYVSLAQSDRAAAMALWPEGRGDGDLRSDYGELLGRRDFRGAIDARSEPVLGGAGAVVSFEVVARYRGNFGTEPRGRVTLRAELAPAGSGWRVVSVVAQAIDGF